MLRAGLRRLRQPVARSSSRRITQFLQPRPQYLIVFDKDGTLQDFDAAWFPFLERNAVRMQNEISREELHRIVGYCPVTKKLTDDSLLAHAGMNDIRAAISKEMGGEHAVANWTDDNPPTPETTKPVGNVQETMRRLARSGYFRLAVSTNDVSENARTAVEFMGLTGTVDFVIGCDHHEVPKKPNPENLAVLADKSGVDLKNTFMVSDCSADMQMAKRAGAVAVGVLSGIGNKNDLDSHSDHILPDVNTIHNLFKPEPAAEKSNDSTFTVPATHAHGSGNGASVGSPSSGTSSTFTSAPVNKTSTSAPASNSLDDHRRRVIIIGAGSAGCVLANRISADSGHNVLLLEAGPPDTGLVDSWRISMPSAMGLNLWGKRYNWDFETAPQKHLNGRQIHYPRGRVLGGSSSINAMVYLRGNRMDYDEWESEFGANGWSYADVLPYFKRMESYSGGGDKWRGDSGPLRVTRPDITNPLFKAFVEAGGQAGFPLTPDINGESQEGFGLFDRTTADGARNSTARAYLHPALERAKVSGDNNLLVETRALVHQILFDGKRAVGVKYQAKNGKMMWVYGEEIILAAGAIGSPSILQMSGVGDQEHLRSVGVQLKHHLPSVGQNFMDHLEVYVQYKCKGPYSLYPYQWTKPHNMARIGLEWFLKKTGVCASNHLETGAFFKSNPNEKFPNIQLHFLPAAIGDCGSSMVGGGHAFQVHMGPMRPTSRGSVRITSPDPSVSPIIDPNFLATEVDRREFREGLSLTRKVFDQPAFEALNAGEFAPGADICSDEQIDQFVREVGESAYHPCGSCRMGSDPEAVVDTSGRVNGIVGLRVVDASIMPRVPTANLNCPTIMIAEKMSDAVLFKEPLREDWVKDHFAGNK